MSLGFSGSIFRSGLFEYTPRRVYTFFLLLVVVMLFFLSDSYWEGNV